MEITSSHSVSEGFDEKGLEGGCWEDSCYYSIPCRLARVQEAAAIWHGSSSPQPASGCFARKWGMERGECSVFKCSSQKSGTWLCLSLDEWFEIFSLNGICICQSTGSGGFWFCAGGRGAAQMSRTHAHLPPGHLGARQGARSRTRTVWPHSPAGSLPAGQCNGVGMSGGVWGSLALCGAL